MQKHPCFFDPCPLPWSQTLLELVDYVNSAKQPFAEHIMPEVVNMVLRPCRGWSRCPHGLNTSLMAAMIPPLAILRWQCLAPQPLLLSFLQGSSTVLFGECNSRYALMSRHIPQSHGGYGNRSLGLHAQFDSDPKHHPPPTDSDSIGDFGGSGLGEYFPATPLALAGHPVRPRGGRAHPRERLAAPAHRLRVLPALCRVRQHRGKGFWPPPLLSAVSARPLLRRVLAPRSSIHVCGVGMCALRRYAAVQWKSM